MHVRFTTSLVIASVLLWPVVPLAQETGRAVRHLLRAGGHDRTGFDDIAVPPPADLPYAQIVDPARYRPGSVSLGTTSDGSMRHSERLPLESDAHYVLPAHRARDTHYGTEEMIHLLLETAERVTEQHPGSRLGVGNISQRNGGDITWSRSHNAGRDADIAFPFVDSEGAPVETDDLVRVHRDGTPRSGGELRIDLDRAWAFVEALLTSEEAQVQWVFVYEPLKRRIIERGAELGADPEVLRLAGDVLHQPSDSARHDDHFHVRIYCSRSDRLEGCQNWGPRWGHADYWDIEVRARIDELLRGLLDPDDEIAVRCLERLEQLGARDDVARLVAALPHASPVVQVEILNLIAAYDLPGVTGPIVPLAESSLDPRVRSAALWTLGRLADPASGPALAAVARRDGRPLDDGTPLRQAATHAARNVYNVAMVPDLIGSLGDERSTVRSEVVRVLRRATGFAPSAQASGPDDRVARKGWLQSWRDWYVEHADEGQATWWRDGLAAAGYAIGGDAERPDLTALVSALRDQRDHVRFVADRWLLAETGAWTPSEGWSIERRRGFWAERLGVP